MLKLEDLTQEQLTALETERDNLKTESSNKATALKTERDEHKATKKALDDVTAEKSDLATKLAKAESDVTTITNDKKKLEDESKTLQGYKEEAEKKAKEEADKHTATIEGHTKWLKEKNVAIDETVFNALGDNLPAKAAYLETLKNTNTPGFKATAPQKGEAPEGQSAYEKAKAAGDTKAMIANAPVKEVSTGAAE